MTRIIVALVVLLGTASIAHAQQLDSVAASIGTRLETGRQAVAVVDFTDLQGNATELGRYLAEACPWRSRCARRDIASSTGRT